MISRRRFLKNSLGAVAAAASGGQALGQEVNPDPPYRRIATEEAWLPAAILREYQRLLDGGPGDEPGDVDHDVRGRHRVDVEAHVRAGRAELRDRRAGPDLAAGVVEARRGRSILTERIDGEEAASGGVDGGDVRHDRLDVEMRREQSLQVDLHGRAGARAPRTGVDHPERIDHLEASGADRAGCGQVVADHVDDHVRRPVAADVDRTGGISAGTTELDGDEVRDRLARVVAVGTRRARPCRPRRIGTQPVPARQVDAGDGHDHGDRVLWDAPDTGHRNADRAGRQPPRTEGSSGVAHADRRHRHEVARARLDRADGS